jgi:hypothetical protein
LATGGDLKSAQETLGHESLETTQIYLGLAKKVQRKMVQSWRSKAAWPHMTSPDAPMIAEALANGWRKSENYL